MPLRPTKPHRFATIAATFLLATSLIPATGCSSDDVKIADAPADSTEKVNQGQTPPVPGADKLPPAREQSQGRPY